MRDSLSTIIIESVKFQKFKTKWILLRCNSVSRNKHLAIIYYTFNTIDFQTNVFFFAK